ncbi:MAG: CDP-diacylglycerol--glycerol-3-phosphate 3-phosphatidyltransferase [Pseudomonadota bacterium]
MANILTAARILLILPFAAMFFINAAWGLKAAFVIFVIASLTDFLDGWVARARGETSALGAALDPIADKLLVAAALLLLTRNGVIHDAGVAGALTILLREILVGGLREALAAKGVALPVTGLAKAKTTVQLVGLGLLIAAAPGGLGGPELRPIAAGVFWLAVILTLWTGAAYTRRAINALR